MEKILFHVCCAPCGGYLSKKFFYDFEPVLFFYNPNIWPKEEFDKRLNEIEKFCQKEKIELIIDAKDNQKWFELTKNNKKDKEGGERCKICFQMRLEKTAQQAQALGFKYFSTSLVISPYKNLLAIKSIGEKVAKKFSLEFVVFRDNEKDSLWQATEKLANQEHFYHQNYCGCLYSLSLHKFLKNLYNGNMPSSENLIVLLVSFYYLGLFIA